MSGSATIVELEPIVLSPAEAATYSSVSKRSLSGLITEDKIGAQKDGPRTLVDVTLLKAHYAGLSKKTDRAPIVFGRRAHALPPALAQSGTDAPMGRIRT